MHINKITGLLVLLCCELCVTITVPIIWNESADSVVNNEPSNQVEIITPQNVQTLQQSQSIPYEYFQYTAQKPQFAADIAAFHGVKHPQQHYRAYPIKPYTGKDKPSLGIHQLLNEDKSIYQPYQKYVQKTEEIKNHVHPTSSGYEIFHPYKYEEPALHALYKDPTLTKIRHDLEDNKNRLQKYVDDTGKPNVEEDEYLEGQQKTDSKLFPQKNVPARYEIHRPERQPIYYRAPPKNSYRDQVLDQRFKHPWNQHNIKIRPAHYKPLKNHIHHLRQHHAMKYDDERNEYPQILHSENIGEPQDGFDIYEKGKQKYTQLRNNVDESLNKAIQQNRPATYQKIEFQRNEPKPSDEEDEFIPIKNYAQVRKTETYKHLPRQAAFDDAETYEEILNAPRLREAVKSTKAQTVYSEEGYEDSAYDHAGEQKHASDHEGHGGFLKEHEKSGGLYKIPSVLGSYRDGKGSEYRDNIEHGKKWKNKNESDEESTDSEDYSEDEHEEAISADIYENKRPKFGNRNKREEELSSNGLKNHNEEIDITKSYNNTSEEIAQDRVDEQSDTDKNSTTTNLVKEDTNTQHEVDKRETNFKVPEINLDSTYLTESDILKLTKQKILLKNDNIKGKYPYYFKNINSINKHSPLRYAENLQLIPKKSNGGTEFYDSKSIFECPDVDENVDPLPEKLKNGENPTEDEDDDEESKNDESKQKGFDTVKKQPRLKGLGDKIDCFKAKYFGENPLDSPFFREEFISNPEPLTAPKLPIFKQLKKLKNQEAQESKMSNAINLSENATHTTKTDLFSLLDKLRDDQNQLQRSLNQTKEKLKSELYKPLHILSTNDTHKSNVYTDILANIQNNSKMHLTIPASLLDSNKDATNVTYNFFQNKEEVTKFPTTLRRKRATPFVYEPYKIIRDNQYPESKKTTTTSNISPLIKQLQSSRVVDRVSRSNHDNRQANPTNSRAYVDIGKNHRTRPNANPTIVDISIDQRRGEPKYEIRPTNHKSEYTPVENKKVMSVEDYKMRASIKNNEDSTIKNEYRNRLTNRGRQRYSQMTTVHPLYDVSSYLPKTTDTQNAAASNATKKTVTATTPGTVSKKIEHRKEKPDYSSEESGEVTYDSNEQDEIISTTTTTTAPRPSFRRRTTTTTTTEKPIYNNEDEPERLKLVTRFRNYKTTEKFDEVLEVTELPPTKYKKEEEVETPKYREKKKTSSKSTLVTDTKKYGHDNNDEEDDMRRREVDAMIGVKQNMDDYMPSYEKNVEQKHQQSKKGSENDDDRNDNDEDDEDDDDDDDDEDEDDEDGVDDEEKEDDDYDDDDTDEEEDEENEEEEEEYKEKKKEKLEVTTPEPTKSTLTRTTDAPPPTVASNVRTISTAMPSRVLKLEYKPIVTRKKIEIHKELPVNKSSPHITQFKQDIKEVEIIKEMPATQRRRPQKKTEVLELYKDDNLAKDINTLSDVEIFRDGIELDQGPKHGGNYRKATKEDLMLLKLKSPETNSKQVNDAETSQSENKKHIELDEYVPRRMHGGNLKSISDIKRTSNTGRNGKLVELADTPVTSMHGGNLKYGDKKRGGRRNEKIIELQDDAPDHHSSQDDDYKSSPDNHRNDRLHGGNYRKANVMERLKEGNDIRAKNPSRDARRNAAELLNSFVQAAPVLTTTPGYILDPSKRMYYYVEA